MSESVVIGLSAVIMTVRRGEIVALSVKSARPEAEVSLGLPFGSFDPDEDRTFELALRKFVSAQTGFSLGYVEQLYTFGDKGRDAPLADVGAGSARVVSVGYLALAPAGRADDRADVEWISLSRAFPWEDWRRGRPAIIDSVLCPALKAWAAEAQTPAEQDARISRAAILFAGPGEPWLEERVLERYELLYEAGLAPEAARDRGQLAEGAPFAVSQALGLPMASDHRRILATALGRLRGKLKYRPIAFTLMPDEFTLSDLQKVVEAISGLPLHKQNFRRAVEKTGLVQPLGRQREATGGRPAELFAFARERVTAGAAQGLPLPILR